MLPNQSGWRIPRQRPKYGKLQQKLQNAACKGRGSYASNLSAKLTDRGRSLPLGLAEKAAEDLLVA